MAARPDPEAPAARLFEWELHSEWETFYGAATTFADVLGEGGLAVFRKLAEEVWAHGCTSSAGSRRFPDMYVAILRGGSPGWVIFP